jgi:DNA-binding CsgD family transcriptional regulator/tetratricopeptide (TPR) repeat protein
VPRLEAELPEAQDSFVSSIATSALLERDTHLQGLTDLFDEAKSGHGRLVFLSGEAGVGKSTLVRSFCEDADGARVLAGACDALFTPRPLAPVADIAAETGGSFAELADRGARPYEVSAALLDELARPTILVLEDLHWADEATLDLLRLLGRRVGGTRGLIVATYRDDELHPDHPLLVVLGGLAAEADVERMPLAPLSLEAVAELAAPHDVDPAELFHRTGGNPFFVTEALASGVSDLPPTVREAVLARAARLDPEARHVLEAVSIVPLRVELGLLQALAGADVEHLDDCVASGMLVEAPGGMRFRHELARMAIDESINPLRRMSLHRIALDTLRAAGADAARLAHHADEAGDAQAVLEFAPLAAERASAIGAHREAAAQYERALRFGDELSPGRRAELLERGGHECYLIDRFDDAIGWLRAAVEIRRASGDRVREGAALRQLSSTQRCGADAAGSAETGRQSVALLEQQPPGRELAAAYGNLAMLALNVNDLDGAASAATRALEVAARFDHVEVYVHALNTLGTAQLFEGKPEGREKLERSLELAYETGLEEHVGRAYIHLADVAQRNRDFELADAYATPGIDYCGERGLDLWLRYMHVYHARTELDRGRWAEAVAVIPPSVVNPGTPLPRIVALIVLGLVRARRGDPEQWTALDEASELATPSGELQWVAPVAAARAEAFWLAGDPDPVRSETEAALRWAVEGRASWWAGELAYWRRRCGIDEDPPAIAAEPWALMLAERWEAAAAAWDERGCQYEAALALAQAEDEHALRRALERLQELGARPVAAMVGRRLRRRGARGLARGPRAATRGNPAGLTPRELEVLELVAAGKRNAEIADSLFLSPRTIDHHVAAILRKLDVRTRSEASAAAHRLGIVEQPVPEGSPQSGRANWD